MDVFICGVCHAGFHDIIKFMEHKNSLDAFSCGHCDALFHTAEEVGEHTSKEHESQINEFPMDGPPPGQPDAGSDQNNSNSSNANSNSGHQQGTTVTVEGLGEVTFVPDSGTKIIQMKDVHFLQSSGTSPVVTLAPQEDGSVLSLQPAETSSDTERQLAPEMFTSLASLQENFSISHSGGTILLAEGYTIENSNKQTMSGIFACRLCQCFSLTEDDIVKHVNNNHNKTITPGTEEANACYSKLEPTDNNQAMEDNSGKKTIKMLPLDKGGTNTQPTTVHLVVETASSQTPKRRRGRPRKSEQQKVPESPVKESEVDQAPPVPDEFGTYRCPRCKKSFFKERHFLGHKCMAKGDYIDISEKVEADPEYTNEEAAPIKDEAEDEEIDADVTEDFKVYRTVEREPWSRGRHRGSRSRGRGGRVRSKFRTQKTDFEVQDPSDDSVPRESTSAEGQEMIFVSPEQVDVVEKPPEVEAIQENGCVTDLNKENQPVLSVAEVKGDEASGKLESEGKQPVIQDGEAMRNNKVHWRDDPRHVPVFSTDEERFAFEEHMNQVDLSCVDHLYTQHEVAQEINAAPGCRLSGREVSDLHVFSCNVCKKVFKTQSHMRLHCLIHTDLKPFGCPQCEFRSNAKGNLYTHMRKHTGNYFKCLHCDFRSCNRSHLAEHEATHSTVRQKCQLCGNDYNTVKSLVNHVRKYHTGPLGKRYLTTFQTKQTQNMAILHVCHICNRKFKKKIDRDRHLFVHNVPEPQSVFNCGLCPYTASRRLYLENHYRKHRLVYVCSVCCNLYLSATQLKNHLQEHLNEENITNTVSANQEVNTSNGIECFIADSNLPTELQSNETPIEKVTEISISETDNPFPSSNCETTTETCNSLETSQSLSEFQVLSSENTTTNTFLEKESVTSMDQENIPSVTESLNVDPVSEPMDVDSAVAQIIQSSENDQSGVVEPQDVIQSSQDSFVENSDQQLVTDGKMSSICAIPSGATVESLFAESINQSWYLPEPDGTLSTSQYVNLPEDLVEKQQDNNTPNDSVATQDVSQLGVSEVSAEMRRNLLKMPPDFSPVVLLNYKPLNVEVFRKIKATFGEAECPTCGRLFHSRVDLEPHLLTHTDEKPYKCEQCNYASGSKENLKRHQETNHEGKTFPCNHCDFVAQSRTSLWHHRQKHATYQGRCPVCAKQFSSWKLLRTHLLSEHPDIDRQEVQRLTGSSHRVIGKLGRRSYKCPYCSRIFHRSSTDLQKHIWIHEGIKPFKCPHCKHQCRSRNNLNVHMLTHSTEKPHLCEECGKGYKSKTALRLHLRTHGRNVLYTCDKCDYNATQKCHLKRHMETHELIRRFVCEHCEYSSNTINYMKVHYSRKHKGEVFNINSITADPSTVEQQGDRVYKCLSCSYIFGNMNDLKRHLRLKHGFSLESLDFTSEDGIQTEIVTDAETAAATEEMIAETSEENQNIEMIHLQGMADNSSATTVLPESYQSLQLSGEVDDKTAVNIIQQIIQQGALESQVTLQTLDADGQLVAVNPETIIVQENGQEVVLDGSCSEGPYVIQYVTHDPNAVQGSEITLQETVLETMEQ